MEFKSPCGFNGQFDEQSLSDFKEFLPLACQDRLKQASENDIYLSPTRSIKRIQQFKFLVSSQTIEIYFKLLIHSNVENLRGSKNKNSPRAFE